MNVIINRNTYLYMAHVLRRVHSLRLLLLANGEKTEKLLFFFTDVFYLKVRRNSLVYYLLLYTHRRIGNL